MTDEIKRLVERLKAHAGKRAPVQGLLGGIPWAMHLRAYAAYCKKWGRQDALIDLEGKGCRGGFGTEELDSFIPGWRAELESPMPPDLATQAATALTLSDEARVRAERERDAWRETASGHREDAEQFNRERQASEALVRELVEGLRPFGMLAEKWGIDDPNWDDDDIMLFANREGRLSEPPLLLVVGDFRKAQALILRADRGEGQGSSEAGAASDD